MAFRGDLEALVLGVLQDRSAHGYEIAKLIAQRTDKLITIGEGQLYPALHGMEAAGSISARWEPQEGKPARKVYEITPAGLEELARHRSVWERLSRGMSEILAAKKCSEVKGG